MLCKKPYMIGAMPCPCQKCLPCLVNRRRVWSHRMLLESYKHGDSCFATLTYDDAHLPVGGTLVPGDYQGWLKRLRRALAPQKIRFFLAGEYGSQTERPHYHAALFGVSALVAGGFDGDGGLLQSTWGKGFTFAGELTYESAQYIAGYVTKKLGQRIDYGSRAPEFTRMSLRKGIGFGAVKDIGRALSVDAGLEFLAGAGDVPHSLRHGMRNLPLGRYLRRELRGEMGFGSKDTPQEAQRMYVLQLLADAKVARKMNPKLAGHYGAKILLDMNKQKVSNLESRYRIHEKPRVL